MKLFENYKYLIETIENMPKKDIDAWISIIVVLICANLFGVYWWLKLKVLGGALLLVCIFILALLLFFSSKGSQKKQRPKNKMKGGKNKMEEKKRLKEDKDDEDTEDEDLEEDDNKQGSAFGDIDFGLGSSEEYQERMDDALGKPLL
jgi:hypothetical protein